MNDLRKVLKGFVNIFGILSVIFMIFTLVFRPIHKEEIFIHQASLSIIEFVILVGFIFIVLFIKLGQLTFVYFAIMVTYSRVLLEKKLEGSNNSAIFGLF